MANWVSPVAIVDRWRSPDEGDLFGMTCYAYAEDKRTHPCVLFGAAANVDYQDNTELEVLGLTCRGYCPDENGFMSPIYLHAFSPPLDYNPIATLSPVGVYKSGLALNKSRSAGVGIAFGGWTNIDPPLQGFQLNNDNSASWLNTRWIAFPSYYSPQFYPVPFRCPPAIPLAIQLVCGANAANERYGLEVSILYRERTVYK